MCRRMTEYRRAQNRSVIVFRLLAVVLAATVTPAVCAVEYFVSVDHQDASDSNDGTSPEAPFKTLAKSVQVLGPGDQLSIAAGIYREDLETERSGTLAMPILIRALPGDEGRVIIRGSDVVKNWTNQFS